jgi:arylsulfatase A-like enzyme/Tfp pilus assembly protein PilF
VVVLWSVGCSRGNGPELRVPDGTPIILISVDTLRSDRLPAYGYNGVETPAIDALRRDGVLFERAYTHVPLTLPAHISLLTGLLPPAHGVRDNLGYTVNAATAPLLQQTLREAGYATGAGVSAFVLRRATGIASGFEFYEDRIGRAADPKKPGVQAVQRPGDKTLDVVRPWLRSVAGRPFFLFFHIFEPHTPYDPPAEYAARYESAYDGEVAAADGIVGDLLDELRALDAYDDSLIFFLSDHGEGLGEHGEAEHGVFLYRSTLQVPLILKLPKSERAGESVDRTVQLIDVYPTVVEALGLPADEGLRGTPLLAQPHPEPRNKPIYAETLYPRLHFGWSDLAAVIVGRHHFIDAPLPELYNLLSDPDEMGNLVGSNPVLETELRTALSAYARQLEAPAATDPETRRRLQALGYVGEATMTDADVLPDPKARIAVLAAIRQAYRLLEDGDLEAAVPAFQHIVDQDPGIEDAWNYLALSYLGQGRLQEAAATYNMALENVPHSMRLSLRAAMLFYRMGRLNEAFDLANVSKTYDPVAAHGLLAQIAFRRGDLDGAEIEARRAVSVVGDRRPEARLILADILIARGEPGQAAESLSRAIDEGIRDEAIVAKLAMTHLRLGEIDNAETVLQGFDDTEDPGVLVALGRTAMARGRLEEAKRWLERAHRVAPTDPTVKLNLGIAAMSLGRLAEAENYFEQAVAGNPASFDGWNALGSVRGSQRDPEGAIEAWERALRIKPMALQVIYNLGVAHAQVGRPVQAVDYLEKFANRAEPGPRRDRALAMAQELRQAS